MSRTFAGPRSTGGFSLDDASRAYRRVSGSRRSATCPNCNVPMQRVIGDCEDCSVLIVRCEVCGRGLVFRREGEGES